MCAIETRKVWNDFERASTNLYLMSSEKCNLKQQRLVGLS